MAGAELERSVLSLIREAVDDAAQPDSTAIALKVVEDLDSGQIVRLAESGIRYYVRSYLSRQRHNPENGNGSNGSARWDAVKADIASGELNLARYSVFTGKTRKWLLDCNVADLSGASDWHRDRGDRHHAMADAMEGLAKTLKSKRGAECRYLGLFKDEIEAATVAEAFRRDHMPAALPDRALLEVA